MDQSCPWSQLAPSTLQWCEQQLCAWVREPSNTYSNLGYIIVGAFMLYASRDSNLIYLKLLGYFNILLGLTSGFYHATNSLIGEIFDFSAMFLFSTYFITAAYARLYRWNNSKVLAVGLALAAVTIGALVLYPPIGPYMFAFQIVYSAFLEYKLWKNPETRTSFKNFVIAFLLLQLAFLIWNLDHSGVLCDPDNHLLTGHAVWHILTAIGTFYIYKFYAQFKTVAAYDFTQRS